MDKKSTVQQDVHSSSLLWPLLGCGVGLRAEHYDYILSEKPQVAWFEAISENFMDTAGRPIEILTKIRQNYPIALHGVSLSIGSADPLDKKYLARLKSLVDRIEPAIVSDHLCWSGVEGQSLHDLLPLPLTDKAADYVAERIQQVQDFLGRKILIENVSTYVTFKHSTLLEWEFLTQVARRAGCGILLDLNNIYVNSKNHGFDPYEYLQHIPADLVAQFHLAGHTDMGEYLFDTHSGTVIEDVWKLYEKALSFYGPVSTLLEWDAAIPEFSELMKEAQKAQHIYDRYPLTLYTKKSPVFNPKRIDASYAQDAWKNLLQDQRRLKSYIRPELKQGLDEISILNRQGSASGEERMSVYAGGYTARIYEALSEVFPATKHILGETAFSKIAEEYAAQYPSQEYNLSLAGFHLPAFFETSHWIKTMGFLRDLACFEVLIAESFHATFLTPFDPARIANHTPEQWEGMHFQFQPSTKLFSSSWPIVDLWQARHTPVKEISIDLVDRPQAALIYRDGFEVKSMVLDAWRFQMLEMLFSGLSLGEACEKLAELAPEQEIVVGDWFSHWVKLGILA